MEKQDLDRMIEQDKELKSRHQDMGYLGIALVLAERLKQRGTSTGKRPTGGERREIILEVIKNEFGGKVDEQSQLIAFFTDIKKQENAKYPYLCRNHIIETLKHLVEVEKSLIAEGTKSKRYFTKEFYGKEKPDYDTKDTDL